MALRGVTLNQLRVFTAKLEAEGIQGSVLRVQAAVHFAQELAPHDVPCRRAAHGVQMTRIVHGLTVP